ncbi:iron chelate uptake ABC transporter family permease subunit [Salininema proteolyticum]|uniref:Iron chelate uptake ABC transporter family permease subunit n=1 Tax=Salininema proteolyticum TaxID=1607685 RepID=A0ABV8TY63_9ACTN
MSAPTLIKGHRPVRWAGYSLLVQRRNVVVCSILALALAGAALLSLTVGNVVTVPPADAVNTLLGERTGYNLTIGVLRWPRIVLAALAGAALALSGALIQAVARNPLASPDIIGVTAGAGLAATLSLMTGLGLGLVAPLALLGGLAAAAAVLLLGSKAGLSAPRFVLAGVAVAVLAKSLTQMSLMSGEAIDAQRAQIWLVGTLAGRGWDEVRVLAAVLLVALPVLVWASRALRTTSLDDPTAVGIGVAVGRQRLAFALAGVALAALTVSQVGGIEFVALAAPHISRRLVRSTRPPLVAAALTGALLLVLADWIGRNAFGDYQLPAGVLTAALGGAYLLYLLIRKGR